LKTITAASAAFALAPMLPAFAADTAAVAVGDKVTLPSGVSYNVVKVGDGPQVSVGELVGIRFKAYAGEIKIDDIFDTPEPYYTRVGAGGLIKGAEEVLPLMRVGDRFSLNVPVSSIQCIVCLFVVVAEYSMVLQ
jgi:FKBP-type peptidyl-prolyl cis-trans isomerase